MHQDLLKKVETFINQSSFQEKIKNADKIYHEFQDKFSPDKLRNLTGDELLNTMFSNNKQDMCWFLEFHPECKELMGTISGYASSTYEIYKKAATGQWMYRGKDSLSHNEILQKAYKIRDGLIDLCDVIKDNLSNLGTIAGYETLSQYWDNQKIWVKKYVHMIFPDYFPSIYKDELIENCADLLKLPLAKNKCAQAGSIVLEAKKCNLRNFEFAYALEQISNKFVDQSKLIKQIEEYKIARNSEYKNQEEYKFAFFSKFQNIFNDYNEIAAKIRLILSPYEYTNSNGLIEKATQNFLNWRDANDLKRIVENDENVFVTALKQLFSDDVDLKERLENFDKFLTSQNVKTSNHMDIASFLLALKNKDAYLLYCKKSIFYKYAKINHINVKQKKRNDDIANYIKFMEHFNDDVFPLMNQILNEKVGMLDAQDFVWFFHPYSGKEIECDDVEEKLIDANEEKDMLEMNNFPKNQILYGPPGTGKTYNTILKAMEIITFEDMFKNWFLSIRQKAGVDALNDYVRHIHKISSEYLKGQNIFSIYDKDQYNQLVETILASEYIKKDPVKNNENSWYKHALKRYGEFLEYLGGGQERYHKISAEYDRMKSLGRIDFITFHQSYSYEEFVEGIKPMLSEMGDGSLKYILSDGIFKKICLEARSVKSEKKSQKIDFSKTRIFKMSLGGASDADVYQYCIEHNIVALGWGDNVDFTHTQTFEDIKKLYNETTGKDDWAPYAVDRFKNWMRNGDIIIISNKTRSFSAIAKIIGDYEYAENPDINYRHYRKVEWLYKGEDIPVSKIYDKSLSQMSIYAFYNQTREGQIDYNSTIKTDILNDIITGDIQKKGEESYILIIDEINRGNISKIFGELITLIEEDKRGKISVTLPYSQKAFSVPENLYIIGTMNTADRSIATIDIALRRRFYFEEMMPNSTLVATNVEGINLQSVMNNLNRKIQALLDRDHQIGHAYFMNILNKRQLENVWYSKILPLLNEYFYGDWCKLKLLVNSFVQEENITSDIEDECSDEKLYSFKSLTGIGFYNAIKELEQ